MADTVATEIARLGLSLPTNVGSDTPLASLWASELDTSPPQNLTGPPPALQPTDPNSQPASWVISRSVELAPGIEARVYFLTS